MTFTAANYDTLVDAPTEMGKFEVTRFEARRQAAHACNDTSRHFFGR